MIDLTNAYRLYIDGKEVATLRLGETSDPIWLYESPVTFTVLDTYKVRVSKGNMSEIYNLSCEKNTKLPNHHTDIQLVDPEGDTCYLATTTVKGEQEGSIIYEGDYLSNGWYSDTNQDGGSYATTDAKYYKNITKGEYFGYPIQVRLAKYELDTRLIDDAIERVNKAFPTFHMSRTTASSVNYMEMDDYEDTWLAAAWTNSTYAYIKFNYSTLVPYYGEYSYNPSSTTYKMWLDTAVHEIGHTLGWADQATHRPSVYDYSRNRARGAYFQANDIAWLIHAFKDRGVDPSVFQVNRKGETDMPKMSKARSTLLASLPDAPVVPDFDYAQFDSGVETEKFSSNIVIATLDYDRTEILNIGGDVEIEYKIYSINVIEEEKGVLSKKELKIPSNERTDIKDNQKYRLYLKEYEKTPCSLVSISNGIVEI